MGDKTEYLGEFEELVLLAVLNLGEDAYGVTIRRRIEEAGRPVSYGALYTTLDRLERKGFLRSWLGDPTPERGGKAKKFYAIEGAGQSALTEAERVRAALGAKLKWAGDAA